MRRPRRTEDFREFSYVKKYSDSEKRFKKFNGNQEVALIFPNNYKVASASLAWSWVQQLFWEEGVAVERFFYEKWFRKFYSIETFSPLDQFRVLMFSFHFELDLENIVEILNKLGIPPLAEMRKEYHPTIIIGGPITFFNVELVKPIADIVVVGDLEYNIKNVSEGIKLLLRNKKEGLKYFELVDNILSNILNSRGVLSLKNYDIKQKFPVSHFITPYSEFKNKRLIEIGRGCIRRCAFCVMGHTKKPVKFVPPEVIEDFLRKEKSSIGIISATITDYPWLDKLLNILENYKIEFSVSSMRADKITDRLLGLLKKSGQKTFTIAPEGVSQKIRNIILKDISTEHLINALEIGRKNNFKNVKLYYIVGFEEETQEDYEELKKFIEFVKKMGYNDISISVNPLIPKKNTPFYNRKLISEKEYNRLIKWLRMNIRGVKFNFESYRFSKKQYLYNTFDEEEVKRLVLRFYNKNN
ncbi:B12-binding domain-containing radical SAM protein [Thermosipho atlanticus]|uniref:Radical SAM superfamily enzyme YgiQ, UPF0313 family n=1 Tax=Thermosipho atlanticus DSM 15807 TaxID=1123380 RepID=A0A1M5RXK6_9BACT|nr:radical SAM protein [Thermosipho atlanticus]SHH30986.1 Radical SAM superfamily enzyme YgiQ, UPF0313 family [Thermosipho atlanticus DSM 15807]